MNIEVKTKPQNKVDVLNGGKDYESIYIETNAYNAILVVLDGRFISYDDVIDGMDINRESIREIVKNFEEAGYNSTDFNDCYEAAGNGNVITGEYTVLDELLAESEYSEEIYSAE